ncbi:DNA/RNA helicase [Pseudomonas aeruginosa]|uniref:helicase-related protein n=1 Tax=Pseudomonas TaxID=286 RepID=UPI0023642A80|nr:helicase-related protein [Pseudomonas guariconensis]MDD2091224.1 helicase-related protein [Pseudomonas guariconensis]
MEPVEVRQGVIARLREDLIGPHRRDEVFQGVRIRPSDIYLTGILWTSADRMGGQDDDGSEGDDEDDVSQSAASLVGQQRPCSMGLSFCLAGPDGPNPLHVSVSFATYDFEQIAATEVKPVELKWTRREHRIELEFFEVPVSGDEEKQLDADCLALDVRLHVRARPSSLGRLVTLTLINRSVPPEGDRNGAESLLIFQSRIEVKPAGSTKLVPRPPRPSANDEDEEIGRLLYRKIPEFATGHQCSASWHANGLVASVVQTEWIPEVSVIAFREDGADVFKDLVSSGAFDAQQLATLSDKEVLQRLQQLPVAYGQWLKLRMDELQGLENALQSIAKRNLKACGDVRARMLDGVKAMQEDSKLLQAFKLANAAMALQHSWKPMGKAKPLRWRPFQLGFILLAAHSVCKADAPDRDVFDLLWFPTGGGKTEAYLALVAMLAFYRRSVHKDPDDGAGNAALMRYTLRLLTAQQFERATSLILACELIRRGHAPGINYTTRPGNKPFSIGLWVGGDATPNHFRGERGALATRGSRDGTTAEQIDECPCCHLKLRWSYDEAAESVRPYCENTGCQLGSKFGLWPVFTVDEDVYRERPTLVIGTIDKFAQLTTKREVAQLFAFGTLQSPDLIIQDELHLISGPLGTIAGVYETAFDWLLRKGDRRLKIIGSTATIRRAADQVSALFDRISCQFPPPGLDHDDSGFAVRDDSKPPRTYLGVTTAGRSAKFTLQAVAGSLLQSTGSSVGLKDANRDGYSTLLAYFNSLRELGGAIVQMLDDVPDSMKLYAEQRCETVRDCAPPRELTSRVSQKEIIEILSELKIAAGKEGSVDTVLATNMVSVGVDVSRLGLMVINGQPKTRSEYIQATSRVGRSVFPGLVVAVLNAAKPRDRSHFETFFGWHATLYRDVEATSVTPFASRARDRALHAALVAMIRHSHPAMQQSPKLSNAPDSLLQGVVEEIERRVKSIDQREIKACEMELNERLENWDSRAPSFYTNPNAPNKSLLISADLNAQRRATGRLPPAAWPTMNNMRSVEASTRFRMAEGLSSPSPRAAVSESPDEPTPRQPRWRKPNG